MGDRRRLKWLLRSKMRSAGRQFEEARRAYREAREEARLDLSRDEAGRARIVCRRYAERRAVELDAELRPDCFDPDSQDCRGCVEDLREGVIETW
ncbi:MAG: hypothetical protein V5A62_05120 [Haloarculaceae archaeon]